MKEPGTKLFTIQRETDNGFVIETVKGYSGAAAARAMGVSWNTWAHHFHAGHLPAGELRGMVRPYYSERQLDVMREFFAEKDRMYWTQTEVSRQLGIDRRVIKFHWDMGHITAPGKQGWTAEQFLEIRRYFDQRRYAKSELMNLEPGLKQLGASEKEILWLRYNEQFKPTPAYDFGGKKSRFYSRKQLQDLLRVMRTERLARGLQQ